MASEPSEQQRNCGCAWKVYTRVIQYTQRCTEHRVMCRPLEQWEIELLPAWARPAELNQRADEHTEECR